MFTVVCRGCHMVFELSCTVLYVGDSACITVRNVRVLNSGAHKSNVHVMHHIFIYIYK